MARLCQHDEQRLLERKSGFHATFQLRLPQQAAVAAVEGFQHGAHGPRIHGFGGQQGRSRHRVGSLRDPVEGSVRRVQGPDRPVGGAEHQVARPRRRRRKIYLRRGRRRKSVPGAACRLAFFRHVVRPLQNAAARIERPYAAPRRGDKHAVLRSGEGNLHRRARLRRPCEGAVPGMERRHPPPVVRRHQQVPNHRRRRINARPVVQLHRPGFFPVLQPPGPNIPLHIPRQHEIAP